MDAFWGFLGTVMVAIIGLISVIVQKQHSDKLDDQKTLLDTVNANIDNLRKESKKDDAKLNKKLDDHELSSLKRFLVGELTKIRDGVYVPSDSQRCLLHEAKREYNGLGGNSYVDEMFDDLVAKGLL